MTKKLGDCSFCRIKGLSRPLHPTHADKHDEVGDIRYVMRLPGKGCSTCGHVFFDATEWQALDAAIADDLLARGVASGGAINFLRCLAHLDTAGLAKLFGIRRETISRWENGHTRIGAAELLALHELARDVIRGTTTTSDRLRSLAEGLAGTGRPSAGGSVRLGGPKGKTARRKEAQTKTKVRKAG